MSRLIVPWQFRLKIERDALERLPEEACGLLLGRTDGDHRRVTQVTSEANVHPGDRRRRYRIDPERLLAAQKSGRSKGLEVVGYYHSHPDAPAKPSHCDRRSAWPGLSYLIVGLDGQEVRELRSWTVVAPDTDFVEEAVQYEPA